jgi:hypothetical protein
VNLLFKFMFGKGKPTRNANGVLKAPRVSEPGVFERPTQRAGIPNRANASSRRTQYAALIEELTEKYDVKVKRWRKSMSGVAWTLRKRDGSVSRWIESPMPTGPVSCAVFLHEIGHHAIGLGVHTPRCLEEYLAWQWALRTMEERKLTISDGVKRRVERSMRYAVSKAVRRGIKRLPAELMRYV